ncbi:MAG: hypothetical protein IJR06_07550, partial [Paludibacteraceae bacterium]|nr:hypothetical protein [Paludibacteraceae bacterium]
FYHTDHLGSTTYITDRKEVAQYVAYTPYGETFKEYKNVTPYKFNGKELDQETGYYYYGARYYDPGTALWFGTDPLAEKYPDVSPYVYCHGNPVVRIDPDGQADWKSIGYGVFSVYSGVTQIEGGAGLVATPTGVSQVVGATLIASGITTIGLGVTKIVAGVIDNGKASSIPTGFCETIGQGVDVVFGNGTTVGRTIGSCADATVGLSTNIITKKSITFGDVVSNYGGVIYDGIDRGAPILLDEMAEHASHRDCSSSVNLDVNIVCPKDNLKVDNGYEYINQND